MKWLCNICKKFTVLTFTFFSCLANASPDPWQVNMYKGVTPISKDMYNLHMIAIGVCAFIGIIVFGVMFYSLIHHRKSRGHKPAEFHENTKLEIIWTIIPFLILVGLAFPATSVLIRQEDDSNSDITVKIVGYQWKWQYQYLDQGINYFSNLSTPFGQIQNQEPKGQWYLLEVDKPLVLPVNKKIRFLVTSNDVVHSWWVPELGVKRDAIPGFMHEAWARIETPGVYRGQCAELCGINHAYMPIVVEAVSENDFNTWVDKQQKVINPYANGQVIADKSDQTIASTPQQSSPTLAKNELMTLGKKKYDLMCAACHKVDGTGIPPMFPALKGSSVAVGKPISRHINLVLNGVPGSAMQAYRDQLTDEEIAAIVTYERNAWENNTNDVIQAAEVLNLRHSNKIQPTLVKKAQVGGFQ